MIRVEIVIKDKWGQQNDSLERKLKREILSAVNTTLDDESAEPVRVQFLGPKK